MTEGYQITADLRMAREDLAPLFADGYRHEIAAIYRDVESNPYSDHSKIHAIITDDLEAALAFIEEVESEDVTGFYVGPNPVGAPCRAASWRRVSASDVLARDYVFFDIERNYKDGPATTEDLRRIRDAVSYLIEELARRGFPKVPARFGVSGNGYYVIYNVKRMEADSASYELFDKVLKAVASLVESKFPTVEVDQKVKDAARLRRISGTVNRKFADHPDQWRKVSLSVKDSLAVSREAFEQLAAQAPSVAETTATRTDSDRHDLTLGEQALLAETMIEAVGDGEGKRHDAGQCLGGLLAHNNVTIESAQSVMRVVAASHNDVDDRLQSIADSYDKYEQDKKVSWRGYARSIHPTLETRLETIIRAFKTRVGLHEARAALDPPDDAYEKPGEKPWPQMDPIAFHGLAGDVVEVISPSSEADPIAILVTFLAEYGNMVGRGPHHMVGEGRHGANLDVILTGDTAVGRKGESKKGVDAINGLVDPHWFAHCQATSLASGEGLIHLVRDPQTGRNKKTGEEIVVDDGVQDKRLFVSVEEYAGVLKVSSKPGNTLSPTLREAWDSPRILRNASKTSPETATSAHISLLGHITSRELKDSLGETDYENGVANRNLWIAVRRSQLIAHPRRMDTKAVNDIVRRLSEAKTFAIRAGELDWDDEAYYLWTELYENDLGLSKPGMVGSLTARAAPITIRLALIYALLDKSPVIGAVHLRAAYAVWKYSEASVRYIFGDATGDHVADRILTVLRETGESSQTDVSDLFGRNVPAARLAAAIELLISLGKIAIRKVQENPRGRPVTYYRAVRVDDDAAPPANVTPIRRNDQPKTESVPAYQATGTDDLDLQPGEVAF